MLFFLGIIIVLAIIFIAVKNLTDKPYAQHLKNKDNKDQREHERHQEEKKHEFWKEKNKIKNKDKKDEFIRDFVVDYIKTSPSISEDKKLYITNRLIAELQNSDGTIIEDEIDEAILRISQDKSDKTDS